MRSCVAPPEEDFGGVRPFRAPRSWPVAATCPCDHIRLTPDVGGSFSPNPQDAVGTKRYDSTSGGEKEIQRTMLELLNQLDGFDARTDVKVILATNKIESLDPALIRPGRIDRKIEFPAPDQKTRRHIFQVRAVGRALQGLPLLSLHPLLWQPQLSPWPVSHAPSSGPVSATL